VPGNRQLTDASQLLYAVFNAESDLSEELQWLPVLRFAQDGLSAADKTRGVTELMSNQFTQKQFETLSTLIMFHAQKVSDYTKAVPNVGMAKRHNEFVETLKKAQTLLHGEPATCDGCIRERVHGGEPYTACIDCSREMPERKDNFKRRAS